MEKIIITTMNQKSMGKSTIALALAGHFYFNHKKRVLLIDADEEQLTVFRKYQRDKTDFENTFDVIDWSIRNKQRFEERLSGVWEDYEIFIIDTPGSLIDFSAKSKIAEITDIILVPISPREFDVDSFQIFMNSIKSELGKHTDLKIIRNYYDSRNKDWKEHDEEFKGSYNGFDYLNANIPERREYSRFEWTVEANNDTHFTNLYNEIERLLNDKQLWPKDQK